MVVDTAQSFEQVKESLINRGKRPEGFILPQDKLNALLRSGNNDGEEEDEVEATDDDNVHEFPVRNTVVPDSKPTAPSVLGVAKLETPFIDMDLSFSDYSENEMMVALVLPTEPVVFKSSLYDVDLSLSVPGKGTMAVRILCPSFKFTSSGNNMIIFVKSEVVGRD